MIDTDKYEGHTEGKWNVTMDDEMKGFYFFRQGYYREQEEDCNYGESRANARLMSDAPLCLEEVKRLREGIQGIVEQMQTWMDDSVGKPLFKSFIDHLKELIE